MRSKKAILNMIMSISYELVNIICGLILPRLILSHFGSAYNGIVSSITQFLQAAILLRAGIGAVTIASLYKPLADKNNNELSAIVNATEKFMKKLGLIFFGALVAFALIYPLFVNEEFDYIFSLALTLILGISTFAQYYFGLAFQYLMEADQKKYAIQIINIISVVLNTVLSALFIYLGCGIHIVKLASAIAFSLNPIMIMLYVKRNYKIDKTVAPNKSALAQRWDAFTQTIANFVNTNTDVVVITIFANVKEVSVYTVYNYVIYNLRIIINTIVHGFSAAFGNMIAKNENELIRKNLRIFEMTVFGSCSVIYTTAGIMIVPFVTLYTSGVNDANYIRPLFAILACIAGSFYCFRYPYQTIIEAAGKFKETRNGAIAEAVINITISIILVIKYGLIGVAVGTLVATVFRSFQYAIYLSKKLVNRSIFIFIGHIIINGAVAGLTVLAVKHIITFPADSWLWWIVKSACVAITSAVISLIVHLIFYRKDCILVFDKAKDLVITKLGKSK